MNSEQITHTPAEPQAVTALIPTITLGQAMSHRLARLSARAKTIVIIVATLAGILLVVYIPTVQLLLGSYSELERQISTEHFERMVNAVGDSQASLAGVVGDNASWDDTYTFAAQPDPAFLASSFANPAFADNHVNAIAIIDNRGQILMADGYDLVQQQRTALPASLYQHLKPTDLLFQQGSTSGIGGFLALPEGIMLVVARPILSSSGSGPSRGMLLYGRWLDPQWVEALSKSLRFQVTLTRANNPQTIQQWAQLSAEQPQVIQELDSNRIAVNRLINDLYGQPAFVFSVINDRAIYARGQATLWYLGGTLITVAVVFSGLRFFLLDKLLISRLLHLGQQVSEIGSQSDFRGRIAISGNDEFTRLAVDINVMLEALAAAEQRRQQAEQDKIRAKSDMLAIISHELRTPLTPIRGYVDLLLIEGQLILNEEQQQYLHTIKRQSIYMGVLVNDLIDLAQIDSGRLELNYSTVDIHLLLTNITHLLKIEADKKQITLIHTNFAKTPYIYADEQRLTQVFINLVSNAIKYSLPDRSIRISVESTSDASVTFAVADSGFGMSPEEQAKLFTMFYRVRTKATESTPGTGLGLAITKALIERHGGTIQVESRPGIGSTFFVTLPLVPDTVPAESYIPTSPMP